MYIAVWVVGMIVSCALITLLYKKIDAGKAVIIGSGFYFSFYIIVSGILVWFDKFSLMKAGILGLTVPLIIGILVLLIKGAEGIKISFDVKKYVPLAILMIVMALLSHNKAELFSTSQDQGLYQDRAMMYMGGYNDNSLEFEEYHNVENPYLAATYINSINEMDGVYLIDSSAARYQIHGVNTFPALLGLWGKMFGLHNMAGILTVFLLITVGAVFVICDNLGMKAGVSLGVAFISGVCPAVMWCSKNTLTEIGLCMLIALFFALATEKSRMKAWCALPLIAFGYYHITITITMPLIIVMLIWMYVTDNNRDMLICIIFTIAGYLTGLKMMFDSAIIYTINNLQPIFDRTDNKFNKDNFLDKVTIICVVVLALLVLLDITGLMRKLQKCAGKLQSAQLNRIIWTIIAVILAAGLVIMFVQVGGKYTDCIEKLSIFAFLYMTGFVMLPLAVLSLIINIRDYIKDSRLMIFAMAFVYVMIIYAAFLWPIVKYYYYYVRYFAPFMLIVPILAGVLLDKIKIKIIPSIVAFLAAGVVIYTSTLLYTDRDLTYGDFEVVEGIVENIGDNSAVMILHDSNAIDRYFMLPVKALTGADIYFADYNELNNQAAELNSMYENVYYLMFDDGYVDNGNTPWEYIYHDVMLASTYTSETVGPLPYQMGVTGFKSGVGLFKYNGNL